MNLFAQHRRSFYPSVAVELLAAPVIESSAQTAYVAGFDLDLNMPSGVTVDDLLLAVITTRGDTGFEIDTDASGSNWVEVINVLNSSRTSIYVKIAEGGDDLTVSTPNGTWKTGCVYRVSGVSGTDRVFGNIAFGNGVNTLSPPNLAPAAGVQNYLAFAMCGFDGNVTPPTAVSSYPAGYTANQLTQNAPDTNRAGYAIAAKTLSEVSSEDPGDYTINLSKTIHAVTLLIAP